MFWDVITNFASIITIISAIVTTTSAIKTKSFSEKIKDFSNKIATEYGAESLTIATQFTKQAKEEYYKLKKQYFGNNRGFKQDKTPEYLTEIEKLINQVLQYIPAEFDDIKRTIFITKDEINTCIKDYENKDKFNKVGQRLDEISETIKEKQEYLRKENIIS